MLVPPVGGGLVARAGGGRSCLWPRRDHLFGLLAATRGTLRRLPSDSETHETARKTVIDTGGMASGRGRGVGFAGEDLDHLVRFMELGWMRLLPPVVALILQRIGDLPRVAVEEMVERDGAQEVWGQAACDGEPDEREVDLAIAAQLHPQVSDPAELERLSVQDRTEAAAHQQALKDRFSRVCATLGVAEPKTSDEVYPFLLALGLVEEYGRGGAVWVQSRATELDPIDVLRLDERAATDERACRAALRFLPIETAIAARFRAAGGRDGRVVTSLLRLAGLCRLPVEQLRTCLIGGLEAGVLTCNRELGALEEHRIFELRLSTTPGEDLENFTAQHGLAA